MHNDLKALEQRWGLALQSASFGVWDLDPTAHQVHYSPEWKQMLGYPPDDAPESTSVWRSRVHPDDLGAMKATLEAHLQGHTPAYSAEFRLRTAAGNYRWVLSRGRVVQRDEAGNALRVVGTLTDLTDRRELEALRAEHVRAVAAQRVKDEFLSRMSHELRTPLNAVLGFAQLLRSQLGTADLATQRRHLGLIEQAGWQLLALVNDVLDLTRAESGQLELQMVAVPVAEAWAAACQAHAALAATRGVTVLTGPLPEHAQVWADAQRLQQVLGQLLGNALKFSRSGGSVRLTVEAEPGDAPRWRLTLQDDGLGIPAAQLPHVFEPFNRVGRPAARLERDAPAEGVGLGLVLCRWLLGQMGGEITLASTEGTGTTVQLLLPAAEPAAAA
ncbi:PAS domain-containing sensor histidine kinase [Rubrivivax rivuli]|uniref:histidine kinase n=1 Tax=Rubrivivax rivuli TaxID=1862385 RepID=A0A437RKM5_9BURK|nr:PAS domain-containing sensor histidine kinase [Rubrivivax rivuli]RVU47308.1 PAS domain S-box protein [Rubrivivax rivuli]